MTHLAIATDAALAAGGLLRANFGKTPKVDSNEAHDIKIELDCRSQRLIEHILLDAFPDSSVLGEEGSAGCPDAQDQWIVDPIDGTVNFFYGIPHFCVSIALRRAGKIVLGVIYDPMADELWTATADSPALLNGSPILVSTRTQLSDAIISVGFSKSEEGLAAGLPVFTRLVRKVKKCRMMGSAALAMAYVATGRLDAYIESLISIWDIAAGLLLVERAGGKIQLASLDAATHKFSITADSGLLNYE